MACKGIFVSIPMRLCSAKDMCGYHIGCREASDTNISIDILMLYADIDAVANGNLLVGDYD